MAITRTATKRRAPVQGSNVDKRMKQATVPELLSRDDILTHRQQPDRDELQWVESSSISPWLVMLLVNLGKMVNIGQERSLKILMDCNYNFIRAFAEVGRQSWVVESGKWTLKEEKRFAELFTQYGKNFKRISDNLESKSVGEVICHYYNWKRHFGFPDRLYLTVKRKQRRARTLNNMPV